MNKKIKIIILILLTSSIYFIYQETNNNNITYVSLGDSLSLGENSYGAISYGYSDYFKDYLQDKNILSIYNKTYTSKTKTITELYNDILVDETITIDSDNYNLRRLLSDADIISLSIGLNDLILETNTEEYLSIYKENKIVESVYDKYEKLISEIKKYYNKKIYVIGYYENNSKYDKLISKINNKYKQLCKRNNDIFIDTSFISNNSKYFDNPKSYYPNNFAYQKISKKMIDAYEKK